MSDAENMRKLFGISSGVYAEYPDAPWLRRHAIQLAAQLPEDCIDAERVIYYLIEIQRTFVERRKPGLQVVPPQMEG